MLGSRLGSQLSQRGTSLCRWGWLAALALLCACGDDDGTSRPTAVSLAEVVTESHTFVDTSRPTAANGDFGGAPHRTIDTRIWLAPVALDSPACRGDRCALVVLAHGFGGSTARFDALARRLAAAGYVVAAPAFPLTNQNAPGGHLTAFGDVASQPADISYVIDEVLKASGSSGTTLYGRIDEASIAAVGHSLGGAAVIAAGRNDCCRDQRIGAAVLVAPAAVIVEGTFREPYAGAGPPTLTIAGSADPVVPPAIVEPFHADIEPPKVYLELDGGDHVFIVEATENRLDPLLERTAEMTIAFLDRTFAGVDVVPQVAERLRGEGHVVTVD
jgi:alpha-beta hydrolase superfamily lysophospholipase